ncbi:hypothetical protein HYFRA_00010224 [Hymenoscyphus fraxineus]|uniref:Uncharacterized protein n=1 Tax=Hymenoscyphus fraxineus TaxID=746836 RepID=A0A9N9KT82_9HELO|nr:hypothetical protein HYFRA_00010224 [Hymenoscyphus fraxineus]
MVRFSLVFDIEYPNGLPGYRTDSIDFAATNNVPYDQSIQEKPQAPVWVGTPQSLDMDRKEWWKRSIGDIVPMLFTVPFFVIVATVMMAHKKPVTPALFTRLNELSKVIATIFPLEFSISVGRAFVKYVNYKLEQGTTLGLLERLVNSRTVLGAVRTQVRLGFIPLLSIPIIALWMFSPIGSQAALRMVTTTLAPIVTPSKISYLSTRQPNYAGSSQFETSWFPGFTSLFSAALVAPGFIKTGPMDLWGNVKIPMLSGLANLQEDTNGWRYIPKENFSVTYASLFGIPYSALPDGNSTFNIESTYMELTCGNRTSAPTRGASGFTYSGLIGGNGEFRGGANITENTNWALGYQGQDLTNLLLDTDRNASQCLDCLRNDFTTSKEVPGTLLFQDFTGTRDVVSIYCVPSQVYVESMVQCTKSPRLQPTCSVSAQRTSILAQPPPITLLSFQSTLNGLTSFLPQSTRRLQGIDTMQNYLVSPLSNTFIESTPTPRYLSNQTSPPSNDESRINTVEMQDFSIRLSQLLNTFLEGSTANATSYLTDTLPLSDDPPATSPTLLDNTITSRAQTLTVPASHISLLPIFICNWPWAIVFLVSTCVLLFASVFASYIRRKTLTRDFLPYVGNLVSQGRDVDVPRGSVRTEGLERSKAISGLKVRLGNVGDVEEGRGRWTVGTGVRVGVGRIGITNWDGQKEGRLKKGLLYL